MARTFGAGFSGIMSQEDIRTAFWSMRIDFPEPWESQYFSDRAVTIDGNDHEALVTNWGEISSLVDREEKRLDVSALTVEFTNYPVMTTSERLSDLFTDDLETLRADVFLNLVDDDGTVQQELMFRGIVQTPIAYDYERVSMTIMALSEAYLNKSALRVVTREDFPAMREADIGATIPIAVGTVEKSPGRVVKASAKTAPVADPNNTSNAKLLDFQASSDAVSQDWTITVEGASEAKQVSNDTAKELSRVQTQVTVGNFTTQAISGTSVSFSHNNNGDMLLVCLFRSSRVVGTFAESSVTYNGVTMPTRQSQGSVEFHWLTSPATGSNTVAVSFGTQEQDGIVFALSLSDAASIQFTPLVGTVNHGSSSSLPSNIWPGISQSKGLVLDGILAATGTTETFTTAPAAAQTAHLNTSFTPASGIFAGKPRRVGLSTRPGNGTALTMSWNHAATSNQVDTIHWGVVVVGRGDIYGQSFDAAGTLNGVKLRLRRSSVTSLTTARVSVDVLDDNAGEPADMPLASGFVDLTDTSPADYSISLDKPVALSGSTRWIRVIANRDPQGRGAAFWGLNTAGGYAGGTAIAGRMRGSVRQAPDPEWDTSLAGQDFRFELLLSGTTYEFFGSVTGFDGTGSVESDSVSDSGQITLLASHWQGTPAAGDVFRFSVDNSENRVIFSESPSDTPVSEIGTIFWADVPVVDAPFSNTTTGGAPQHIGRTGGSFFEWAGHSFSIETGAVVAGAQINIRKIGAPTIPVNIEIRPTSVGALRSNTVNVSSFETTGTIPDDSSLGVIEIPAASISSTTSLVGGTFDIPLALSPGRYFILARVAASGDDDNYYELSNTNSGVLPSGEFRMDQPIDENVPRRIEGSTTGISAQIDAVSVNKQTSIDDGTGENVALVGFDVPIPDAVAITANLIGVEDDLSGTYTGTASALIRRPDALIHWLAIRAGAATAEIDLDGTFADSGTSYGALYLFDGLIQDNETYKQLFLRLAFECRSAIDWPIDTLQLKFLPLKVSTPDRTITFSDVMTDRDDKRPMVSISRSDVTKLINFVDVRFQRVAAATKDLTAYRRVINARSLTSIAKYGQREEPELFFMDFVRKEDMATDLAQYYASRLAFPRRIVEVTVKYPFLDVEKDDSIAFSLRKVKGVP